MSGVRRRALLGAPKPGSPVAMTCDANAVNEHGRSVANPPCACPPHGLAQRPLSKTLLCATPKHLKIALATK